MILNIDIINAHHEYDALCKQFINSNFSSKTQRPHNTRVYRKLCALLMQNNNNKYDSEWWYLEKVTNKHNNKNTCTLVRSNILKDENV